MAVASQVDGECDAGARTKADTLLESAARLWAEVLSAVSETKDEHARVTASVVRRQQACPRSSVLAAQELPSQTERPLDDRRFSVGAALAHLSEDAVSAYVQGLAKEESQECICPGALAAQELPSQTERPLDNQRFPVGAALAHLSEGAVSAYVQGLAKEESQAYQRANDFAPVASTFNVQGAVSSSAPAGEAELLSDERRLSAGLGRALAGLGDGAVSAYVQGLETEASQHAGDFAVADASSSAVDAAATSAVAAPMEAGRTQEKQRRFSVDSALARLGEGAVSAYVQDLAAEEASLVDTATEVEDLDAFHVRAGSKPSLRAVNA